MNNDCGCCAGVQILTPQSTANRPGLEALTYRVGTHGSFLQTMLARLSSQDLPALAELKTRQPDDFSIALLDAWATIADVLTFYQERIANEGYLRTATERHSILELARLVGYQLRPGVSASVYLAFTLDQDFNDESMVIPAGTQAQSIPQPGEQPQIFETEADEPARTVWNQLPVRLTRPHYITEANVRRIKTLYLEGTDSNLKANDRLLFVFDPNTPRQPSRTVEKADLQASDRRTQITLRLEEEVSIAAAPRIFDQTLIAAPIRAITTEQITQLVKPPTVPPANKQRLTRTKAQAFSLTTDFAPKVLTQLYRPLQDTFYKAFENTPVTQTAPLDRPYKFNVKAAPFGHNAPLKIVYGDDGRPVGNEEWGLETLQFGLATSVRDNDEPIRVYMMEQGRMFSGTIPPIEDPDNLPAPTMLNNGVQVSVERAEADEELGAAGLFFIYIAPNGEELKRFRLSPADPVIGVRFLALAATAINTFALAVRIDEDTPTTIGLNQKTSYETANRRVAIAFGRDGVLTIQDTGEGTVLSNRRDLLPLDAQYDKVLPGSWVLLERPEQLPESYRVQSVQSVSIARYGITGKVTQLVLDRPWLRPSDRLLSDVRGVTVYAESQGLTLAETVIPPVDEPIEGDDIELAELYGGLEAGRWLILCGERTDIDNTAGVEACELVMLAAVRQDVATIPAGEVNPNEDQVATDPLPGDTPHSFLSLATPLKYTYKRDTVKLYGNVVKATHGETREEVLGSGDASQTFQAFQLRHQPLTFISAPTPSGIQSTLEVRVNQVQWHEARSLGQVGAGDRAFTTRQDNESHTTVIFGDGQRGLRLPTGIENVRAKYRNGIGKGGNVKAEQISLLASRPMGVQAVINPLPASGGTDPESRDQARANAPLAVMALDRLVSLQDYEDFARTFAGIGKASAVQLSDGRRSVIHLTIAGEDDILIIPTSDLYRNLKQSLQDFGSSNRWVQIATRDLMVLILSAKVRLHPDYAWETVEPQVRSHLLTTFSFQKRALGQDVQRSEVLAAIHQVAGVDAVDLDVLSSIAESEVIANPEALSYWLNKLAQIAQDEPTDTGTSAPPFRRRLPVISTGESQAAGSLDQRIAVELGRRDKTRQTDFLPAQLAILSPDMPDALKLEELKS